MYSRAKQKHGKGRPDSSQLNVGWICRNTQSQNQFLTKGMEKKRTIKCVSAKKKKKKKGLSLNF